MCYSLTVGISGVHARPNKNILLGIVHTIHGFSQISRSSQKHRYHLIGVAFVRADLVWPVIQQIHDRDRRLRNTAVIVSSDSELLVRDLVQSYVTRARSLVSHKIDDSTCADQFAIVVRSHRLAWSFHPCCIGGFRTWNRPAGAITK